MPHPRRAIPFEDWSDYLDVPETPMSEMTLRELRLLYDRLTEELEKVEAMIEERMKAAGRNKYG